MNIYDPYKSFNGMRLKNTSSTMRPTSLLLLPLMCLAAPPLSSYDVFVYGSSGGGLGAAIAAADAGLSVLLAEPLTHLGGMAAAGGVGLMNQGAGDLSCTGLCRVWGALNAKHYNASSTALNLFPDPFVMEKSWRAMLNASGVTTTLTGCALVAVARGAGACLASATLRCGAQQHTVAASVFIDGSYDGDVARLAGGVSLASGREAASEFNESLAGVNLQDDENESFWKQNLYIDAYGAGGALLPGVSPEPLPPPGTGDDRLMAFSYFPCVTTNTSNAEPYPRPAGYDPARFALLQAQIEGVMANGRYPMGPDLSYFSESHAYEAEPGAEKLLLCCGVGPVNCDEPDAARGYATANASERLRLQGVVRDYLLGSLYYMANDPRVPNYTRYAVGRWGLCRDSYADTGFWPPQLYVRVSNRLRGAFLITQNNIAAPRSKPDSVAVGVWEFDQHTMSRRAVPHPANASRTVVRNEGYMRADLASPHLPCHHPAAGCAEGRSVAERASANWYDVPFPAMLPQRAQASNLAMVVAISATSIAYSSTRIEGMYVDLGVAAGVAAAQVLRGGGGGGGGACPALPLLDVNVTAVQDVLVGRYKQRVHGPPDGPVGGGA